MECRNRLPNPHIPPCTCRSAPQSSSSRKELPSHKPDGRDHIATSHANIRSDHPARIYAHPCNTNRQCIRRRSCPTLRSDGLSPMECQRHGTASSRNGICHRMRTTRRFHRDNSRKCTCTTSTIYTRHCNPAIHMSFDVNTRESPCRTLAHRDHKGHRTDRQVTVSGTRDARECGMAQDPQYAKAWAPAL